MYDDAGDAIESRIRQAAGAGDRPTLAQLQQLLGDVRKELEHLQRRRDSTLYHSIEQSVSIGTAPFGQLLPPSQLFGINHQAVAFMHHFTAGDGLQLSERLWRIQRGAVETLTDHIQFAIINGESAHQAAMRARARGETVDRSVLAAADAGRATSLSTSIREFMTGAPDPVNGRGIVYQAERVFRTEINRAHGEAYMGAAFQTDGIIGVKFTLSPNHRVRDVCDTHASADLYGFGPGVYPDRTSCPWPAHPNTLNFVAAVLD
ncbi:hypothetical protein JHS3_03020 [Jeongeupia sp. HS-3]|uniref:hypothetical protein n=1 Tax=Jeongeupia sp. HS-3 TaxID=1009682 RepID=UPI0018A57EAE|nr:hypothetical protein [Jeongeupia sp. HS-3]BCL74566.1 hypothetical protein JHS3_03020 [Jeongeupia sp. HS-3]